MRPVLMVPIKDREHFLEIYFEKGGLGGMFIRGLTELDLADEVDLDIRFLQEQVSFRVRGVVRWRRTTGGRRSLPPGLGIEFSPLSKSGEKKLLDYAMGREVSIIDRGGHRYEAHLAVRITGENGKLVETTDDISEGGAFLLTEAPYTIGDLVTLNVRPPGAIFGIPLSARVAWLRAEGDKGVGVEFIFENGRQRSRIARLVKQLKSSMIDELRVRLPRQDPRS